MPQPTPALPDEILEEIFLRLPPDEPACLVRASLTSKLWLSLLFGPSFQGRYREFHGAPPMLGFVYSFGYKHSGPLFVSTTKFVAHLPNDEKFDVLDCRHGRILLGDKASVKPMTLLVCDPMTGYWMDLSAPKYGYYDGYVAAVLCTVNGCDHRSCHEGPFRVVFVGVHISADDSVTRARVASLQMDEWSEPCSHLDEWSEPCSPLDLAEYAFIERMPPVLVQDSLYFMLTFHGSDDNAGIIEYHLGSQLLALIDVPIVDTDIDCDYVILISMGDGSLGFAHVDRLTLNLWSRLVGSHGAAAWTHRTVINLENLLLPVLYLIITPRLIGSVEGRDIIFMNTHLGIYQINLKSLQWKKISREQSCDALFPYMRFYSRPGISLATPLYDFGTTLKYVIYWTLELTNIECLVRF
jgi:hypothetical protein